MILGYDLDGTLDHRQVADDANAAFKSGHQVHVLSGYLIGDSYGEAEKLFKLAALRVRYTKFHLCSGNSYEEIGAAKARVINQYGIQSMIDDSPIFVEVMRRLTRAKIVQLVPVFSQR